MKILYVLDCKIDQIGGSQKSTITTVNGMLKGNDISLICEEPNDKNFSFFKKKITFYFFKKKKNKYINLIKKMFFLKRIIRNNGFDVIHVQNTRFFVITAFALKFGIIKKNNVKYIYTDRDFYDAYTKVYRFLIKKLAKSFDIIVCTTPMNKELWSTFHPNVKLISNALEDEWFDYDSSRKKNTNDFTVGFCGRFVKYKRWDNVLKICNNFKNKFKFSFAISLSNDSERKEFDIFKKELDKILGEDYKMKINATYEEIIDFYYNIDMFILTSNKESFGRTLIEAMTKHNIVFGTNSGGVPYVMKNDKFMYEVDQLEELYEKIDSIMQNENEIKNLKMYFYNFAKNNFHAKSMIEKYRQLYILDEID